MRFSQSTHLFFSFEILTSTIRTGLPILVGMVNSVIIFLSQMTLIRWLTFLLRFQTVIVKVLLFWIYFFLRTLVFVPQWLSLHWDILIMSLSQFSLTFHQIDTGMPRLIGITCDYSRADWDGLCDHLRDVPWEDIFKLGLLLLLVSFVSGFRLEMMYVSLIENVRSNLTHLHGFQLLLLLP